MNHSQADTVLIELHYLPCITYFKHLQRFRKIIFEINEHYTKQTYRNRCYILGANSVQALTIPVSKAGKIKAKTKDILLDQQQRWQKNHWRSIQSAYGKSPFFDFFADYFHDIFFRNYQFLIDFNLDLLTKCLTLLDWHDKEVDCTSSYVKASECQWIDFRDSMAIQRTPPDDRSLGYVSYSQTFGKDFVPNLSVIDLLFCEGANANMIIGQSSLNPS